MTSAGKLESRFFWERINDGYLIYDRQRGAGCFGENFIATAVDGPTAETMCGLMNRRGNAQRLCAELRMLGSPTRGTHLGERQSGTVFWEKDGWPFVEQRIAEELAK